MRQFKKSSIFKRMSQPTEVQEPLSGILAVWGSPGSGKTTLAVKTAKYLSDKGYDTILLLCDTTAPMLPCIVPSSDIENESSLCDILSKTYINETLIKHHLVMHKKYKHLTFLGLQKGENEYSCPPYTEDMARDLILTLGKMASYVVIDCSSYIANDILSAVALLEADDVLRVINCDLKSVSYLSSQLPLLRDKAWEQDKQIKILNNVKPNEPVDNMGNVVLKLPHIKEIIQQSLEGNLIETLIQKESRAFKKGIAEIVKEVFNL